MVPSSWDRAGQSLAAPLPSGTVWAGQVSAADVQGVPQTLLGSLCSDTHQSASPACSPSKPRQPSLSPAHLFTALYAARVERARGSVALQPRPLGAREQWACGGLSG